jgi:hypothetical protein
MDPNELVSEAENSLVEFTAVNQGGSALGQEKRPRLVFMQCNLAGIWELRILY